ncbi:thiamine pyrophosphate-dependent enzyme [Shigella flexneri]
MRRSQKFFSTSGGLYKWDSGSPAAIGAHIARRDATVLACPVHGSFMMNVQELTTVKR